ncbi:class III cytochrome C family protein [Roseateles sp. PN1]|uniref:class III cytochrome C family protein n=1 Tax=Roseateles sp. PN1 TaxID=3137372 RepID=UPI003138F8D4
MLAFVYPHLMLGPGPLVPAHAELSTDCFACHAPLLGVSADRCMACHALADIGLRTSKGVAIKAVSVAAAANVSASASAPSSGRIKLAFHQELAVQNCVACHSDHAGPKLVQLSHKPFSHDMLRPQTQERCESCHQAPGDPLHRQGEGSCSQCHRSQGWKPATFDHDKLFRLDADHNASCKTCHSNGDYRRYTCFGCHEHTPANTRAEHEEEGIQDLDNCVRCHRSADGEVSMGGERQQGSSSRRGREGD